MTLFDSGSKEDFRRCTTFGFLIFMTLKTRKHVRFSLLGSGYFQSHGVNVVSQRTAQSPFQTDPFRQYCRAYGTFERLTTKVRRSRDSRSDGDRTRLARTARSLTILTSNKSGNDRAISATSRKRFLEYKSTPTVHTIHVRFEIDCVTQCVW
jgi:hypothetical protein